MKCYNPFNVSYIIIKVCNAFFTNIKRKYPDNTQKKPGNHHD